MIVYNSIAQFWAGTSHTCTEHSTKHANKSQNSMAVHRLGSMGDWKPEMLTLFIWWICNIKSKHQIVLSLSIIWHIHHWIPAQWKGQQNLHVNTKLSRFLLLGLPFYFKIKQRTILSQILKIYLKGGEFILELVSYSWPSSNLFSWGSSSETMHPP